MIDQIRNALIAAALSLSACSTMQYTPNAQQANEPGVRVLYEYPLESEGTYTSLGVIDVEHYQPGWSAPTVLDVMPKLKTKAASIGGNALIVRSHQVGQFDRSISISAEVLAVNWVKQGQ